MSSRKKPDDWKNPICAGLGERPRLRELIDQAVAVWGCSEFDAYLWTERVQMANPSLNLREAKAVMQSALDQRRVENRK